MRRTQTREPHPAIRIVVLEGKDAVPLHQQRTAVAPVVEVRDQNDQPVRSGGSIASGAATPRSGR